MGSDLSYTSKKQKKHAKIEYIVQGDGQVSSVVFTEEQRQKYDLLEESEQGNTYISNMGDVVITRFVEQKRDDDDGHRTMIGSLVACLIMIFVVCGFVYFAWNTLKSKTQVVSNDEVEGRILQNNNVGSGVANKQNAGLPQGDEAEILEIVWSVFSPNNVEQVCCGDFDMDGQVEAFIEGKGNDDEIKKIWFMVHTGEFVLLVEGGYLHLAGTIELSDATLILVDGRHGLESAYYVDGYGVGKVGMPDNEWWYSVYKENGILWGTRVEYSDGKDYVDYRLKYDGNTHTLKIL